MSNYVTWEEVVAVYPSIAKDRQSEIDATSIAFACDYINGKAGAKYTVPFNPVPSFIKGLVIDLVYWTLKMGASNAVTLKEWIDERITDLVSGSITLTDPTTGAPLGGASSGARLTTAGWRSSFGMGNPIDWQEDRCFDVNVDAALIGAPAAAVATSGQDFDVSVLITLLAIQDVLVIPGFTNATNVVYATPAIGGSTLFGLTPGANGQEVLWKSGSATDSIVFKDGASAQTNASFNTSEGLDAYLLPGDTMRLVYLVDHWEVS